MKKLATNSLEMRNIVRHKVCPPSFSFKSKRDYCRKAKHKNNNQDV